MINKEFIAFCETHRLNFSVACTYAIGLSMIKDGEPILGQLLVDMAKKNTSPQEFIKLNMILVNSTNDLKVGVFNNAESLINSNSYKSFYMKVMECDDIPKIITTKDSNYALFKTKAKKDLKSKEEISFESFVYKLESLNIEFDLDTLIKAIVEYYETVDFKQQLANLLSNDVLVSLYRKNLNGFSKIKRIIKTDFKQDF